MEVKIEDNSQQVLAELDKATEKALFAIGLLGVQGCVEKAEEHDAVTGRPTVDTGRYVSGFGFVTPNFGAMANPVKTEKPKDTKPTDNFSGQRSQPNTVVIANNVEYAPYLEFGSGTQQGGHHARYIMKRGIESKFAEMQRQTKQIFEGKDIGLSLNLPTGD